MNLITRVHLHPASVRRHFYYIIWDMGWLNNPYCTNWLARHDFRNWPGFCFFISMESTLLHGSWVESLRGSNRQELVSKNGYISAARYWELRAAASPQLLQTWVSSSGIKNKILQTHWLRPSFVPPSFLPFSLDKCLRWLTQCHRLHPGPCLCWANLCRQDFISSHSNYK